MESAVARAHRALIRAELNRMPDPPRKWRAEWDLELMRAFLSGGGLEPVVEATGYAASTCWGRLSRMIPGVMSHDTKAALLAELEARVKTEKENEGE